MNTTTWHVSSDYLRLLEEQMMGMKSKSYALMQIEQGHTVLDVGCGPGTDTIHLAHLVGQSGEVVGLDYDDEMIANANQRALEEGVSGWVKHQQGNATKLPFDDAQFDSCRSERLFQHLLFPERALFEMARVTKPNGWVVVLDTDWGTCSISTSLINIERRIVNFAIDNLLNNGYSGRRLLELFRFQGLKDVSIEVLLYQTTSYALAREVTVLDRWETESLKAGVITRDELDDWHDDLEQLEREKSFFASFNLVLAAGRR
jgi:ubiquinone/menaquinone biosynthesis C-methylase UbiE